MAGVPQRDAPEAGAVRPESEHPCAVTALNRVGATSPVQSQEGVTDFCSLGDVQGVPMFKPTAHGDS